MLQFGIRNDVYRIVYHLGAKLSKRTWPVNDAPLVLPLLQLLVCVKGGKRKMKAYFSNSSGGKEEGSRASSVAGEWQGRGQHDQPPAPLQQAVQQYQQQYQKQGEEHRTTGVAARGAKGDDQQGGVPTVSVSLGHSKSKVSGTWKVTMKRLGGVGLGLMLSKLVRGKSKGLVYNDTTAAELMAMPVFQQAMAALQEAG